jgi:AIG2-like family.
MPLLFSYGTLQQPNVQLATFGRQLSGTPDSLVGYEQSMVAIDDPEVVRTSGKTHHPIVKYAGEAGARVSGTVFEITAQELEQADRYEVSAYKRVAAPLSSGRTAWVYVDAKYAPPT